MRLLYLIAIGLILSGCNLNSIEIKGTAQGMDGGIVTITGASGKTYFKEVIKSGHFLIPQQPVSAYGYFTLSILSGDISRDYEVYLEAGQYAIEIPQKENEYLKIKTDSKTQIQLSDYYNLENREANKYRQEDAMWNAKLKDPKVESLSDEEFKVITDHIAAGKARQHGLTIAILDMFIKKHPQTDIIPHIIGNMDYQADPEPFYLLFKKLSPEVQNSKEGKELGMELQQLSSKK